MKNKSIFSFLIVAFLIPVSSFAQNEKAAERVFIKIEIKGLACPYCAYGMERELKKIAGVEDVEIELEEGMAYISTPVTQKPTKAGLAKIIEDAGFTAGEIAFGGQPFPRSKKPKKRKGRRSNGG